jgi:hypothetical protein
MVKENEVLVKILKPEEALPAPIKPNKDDTKADTKADSKTDTKASKKANTPKDTH